MKTDSNPYRRIGVRTFINCCGTRTIHGGTLMLPEVKEAMVAASNYFVNLNELMEGVGRRLAELTGAEWGIVTAGAAAALFQATAACVAGADPEKMLRLPNAAGLKDRVVTWRGGRYTFDQAIRMAGVEIVEVGTRDELVRMLDERTAMFFLLGTREGQGPLRLEEIAELTRPRGIPILVDASDHFERPIPYLGRGATMVAYSGGKYLRGPQCAGLLLGEEAWVRAAGVNASPHHTLGRALKVGKEEIMGMLAAVEYWATERDCEAERRQWEADIATISEQVTRVPTVTTEVRYPKVPTVPVPRLEIRWDGERIGLTGLGLREQLLKGEPCIMLDDRWATDGSLFIEMFSLQPGEAEIVGSRIREALESAPPRRSEPVPPPAHVAGSWGLDIQFVRGTSHHRIVLEQQGCELSGVHRTRFLENPLSGRVRGAEVTFFSLHPFEGVNLFYRFIGRLAGDAMEGAVELGNSTPSSPGPLNQREYGEGRWRARRMDSGGVGR